MAPAANDAGHQQHPEPVLSETPPLGDTAPGTSPSSTEGRRRTEDAADSWERREERKTSALMEEEKMDGCCDTCEAP